MVGDVGYTLYGAGVPQSFQQIIYTFLYEGRGRGLYNAFTNLRTVEGRRPRKSHSGMNIHVERCSLTKVFWKP